MRNFSDIKEPVFYRNSRMTWVANELVSEGFHFFLECMRVPPNWHIWVYMVGSEREAEMYQTTITLFREDEYGRVGEAGFSAQRSYTGQVSDFTYIYYVLICPNVKGNTKCFKLCILFPVVLYIDSVH